MELTILLEDRLGIHLSDADIGRIETIRDLLHLSIERAGGRPIVLEERTITVDIERWLAPTGVFLMAFGFFLYALNWVVMRGLFRLQVTGAERLPAAGPLVITPNHVSYLDGMVIAAALPLRRLRHVFWSVGVLGVFFNPLARVVSRATHLFPVDAMHPAAGLEAAARVKAGNVQVWFPEGWRSPDGRLQRFLPGIGQLLLRSGAPAVPAYIAGAFDALPRARHVPKLHRITVTFGHLESVASLRARGIGRTDEERVVDALRQCVIALGAKADGTAGPAVVADHAANPVGSARQ
jgi:long-chain acyl-CoA synthetase